MSYITHAAYMQLHAIPTPPTLQHLHYLQYLQYLQHVQYIQHLITCTLQQSNRSFIPSFIQSFTPSFHFIYSFICSPSCTCTHTCIHTYLRAYTYPRTLAPTYIATYLPTHTAEQPTYLVTTDLRTCCTRLCRGYLRYRLSNRNMRGCNVSERGLLDLFLGDTAIVVLHTSMDLKPKCLNLTPCSVSRLSLECNPRSLDGCNSNTKNAPSVRARLGRRAPARQRP